MVIITRGEKKIRMGFFLTFLGRGWYRSEVRRLSRVRRSLSRKRTTKTIAVKRKIKS